LLITYFFIILYTYYYLNLNIILKKIFNMIYKHAYEDLIFVIILTKADLIALPTDYRAKDIFCQMNNTE
jgi:hypothetical protein